MATAPVFVGLLAQRRKMHRLGEMLFLGFKKSVTRVTINYDPFVCLDVPHPRVSVIATVHLAIRRNIASIR